MVNFRVKLRFSLPFRRTPAISFLLLFIGFSFAQPSADRRSVPVGKELADAERSIRDLFQADYAKRKPTDQVILAVRLLSKAKQTKDDPISRFVLLRESADLAKQGGDLLTAIEAYDLLGQEYLFDSLPPKAEAVIRVSKSIQTASVAKDFLPPAFNVVIEAIQRDDFDLALKAHAAMEPVVQKAGVPALKKRFDFQSVLLREGERELTRIRPLLQRLQTDAADPEANLEVGKFQCFFKNQWENGLTQIARGSDSKVRDLARSDLAKPSQAGDRMNLGDGWYDFGQSQKEPVRSASLKRAFLWYNLAMPQLAGLNQTRIEKRLKELQEFSEGKPIALPASANQLERVAKLSGHTTIVDRITATPNGRNLISASSDKSARVWDVASKSEQVRFLGHNSQVYDVALSKNAELVASCGADKTIRVWEINSVREIFRLEGKFDTPRCAAFLADGKKLLTGHDDRLIRIWNVDTKKEQGRLIGHTNSINRIILSQDGNQAISSSNDGSIRVWNIKTGRLVRFVPLSQFAIVELALSPDGHRLYCGCNDESVRVVDLDSGKEVKKYQGGVAVALSPDGKRLATAGKEKVLYCYDTGTGKEIARQTGAHEYAIRSATFFQDNSQLATVCEGGVVQLWRLK